MAAEDREVLRRTRRKCGRDCRGRGLEPDRDEDDLAVGPLRDLDRLVHPLDHADVAAAGLEGAAGAGNPEEVAVGRDDRALPGELDRRVDLALRRDADRAARAHHDPEALGEHGPETVARDRGLVGAADVHEVQIAAGGVDRLAKRLRHLSQDCHVLVIFYPAGP